MKTIEEIKNDIAVSYGYNDWRDLLSMHIRLVHTESSREYSINALYNYEEEAMQEYAKQGCDEQIQDCYINAEVKTICESVFDNNEGGYFDIYKVVVCEESILNTPNVVTTK